MMRIFQRSFYATRQDLLPGLLRLETEIKLQYVLRGMFPSPNPIIYFSTADIPNLGISRYGHYIGEDVFLVMNKGVDITADEAPQHGGGILYDIGLLENPTAFSFKPAGQYGGKTIIQGCVDTATGDPKSIASCKWFWRGLAKLFKKVGDYYVGPEAYRLLEEGWRLTAAIQCPPDLDLRIG